MIRVKTNLENNGVRVTLIDINTDKQFTFWGGVDTVERLALDLGEACRLAREKLGLPQSSGLIVPLIKRN